MKKAVCVFLKYMILHREELCNQKNHHDKELVLLQSDTLSYIHDDEIAQRLRNIKVYSKLQLLRTKT